MSSTCRLVATHLALFAVVISAPCVTVQAQSNKLYLTNANADGINSIAQGGSVSTYAAGTNGGWAIAAGATIHTLGGIARATGREFDLLGNPLGATYSGLGVSGMQFYDGTTDGTYNYTANWSRGIVGGTVYRADTDWTGLTPIFTVSQTTLSITYDAGHNTLWLGTFGGLVRQMSEYALDGTLLNTVQLGANGLVGALAYDPTDQTLWASRYIADGTMSQYNRAGNLLSSVDYGNQLWVGGEFSEATAAPEPASLVLLGTGLLGIGAVARRKRK